MGIHSLAELHDQKALNVALERFLSWGTQASSCKAVLIRVWINIFPYIMHLNDFSGLFQ